MINYEYNQTEATMLLSYLCYGQDGIHTNESPVYIQTLRSFTYEEEEVTAFDFDFYFPQFMEIVGNNHWDEIVDYCLDRILRTNYKKLLVHLIEGVVADGNVSELEKLLVSQISIKMDIDNSFYNKVVEVMMTKYHNSLKP